MSHVSSGDIKTSNLLFMSHVSTGDIETLNN